MGPMHLLVLECDPERREALLGTLRSVGHHAVAAPDAVAAAAAIRQPGFDALVLDLGLPDLDVARLHAALVPAEPATPEPLAAAERRHIALMLRHTGGNKRQAAHLLGISRSTLLHKVRKYGLTVTLLLALVAWDAGRLAAAQVAGSIPSATVRSGTLSFDGHGTPGDFTGSTSTVTGEMTGGDSLGAVRGWVEAPVQTLVTGNDRRDRDLNKSMESDKYPSLRFDLRGVTAAGGGTPDSTPVTLQGALVIHGVTRDVSLPGFVRREGEALRVRTDFPLDLKDYRIGGLTKMLGMLKMDEHIVVHVNALFAPVR